MHQSKSVSNNSLLSKFVVLKHVCTKDYYYKWLQLE